MGRMLPVSQREDAVVSRNAVTRDIQVFRLRRRRKRRVFPDENQQYVVRGSHKTGSVQFGD